MATQTFPEMPTVSSLVTAYASLSASVMIFRTMFEQLVPLTLRNYAINLVKHYWKPRSSELTLVFEEKDGYNPNNMFSAAEVFLATKINRDSKRLRITKSVKENHINIKLSEYEEIIDSFEEVKVTWKYRSQEQKQLSGNGFVPDKRYLELKFDNNKKDIIIDAYLPFIIEKAREIKIQKKAVQLHNLQCLKSRHYDFKETVNLNHPSTFETLAMDQKLKKEIMDDLNRFVKRKVYYERVGKAWKRGYLLYGPPGTGKSSLIAAMANHLKFDIFDLQLTNVKDDSSLKDILLETTNRSTLVIEDIDCSIVPDRKEPSSSGESHRDDPKFTLSGLLNFIDGLWSCCGDERIIVFTTNHKERLDPALLRPGRMDMHINMSYLTMDGFKTLAANYLNIHDDHRKFREIKQLIKSKKVTPAEVVEELMKFDNVELALEGLVKFLKRKMTVVEEDDSERILEVK